MFPLVSVIIPVYNVKHYIRECIDSVIHQTYSNLDIILIDDGSVDGSDSMCDYYKLKDKRIRVIHQENHGLSAARNAGLDVMLGDFVSFLDSDDSFFPDMIQKMVSGIVKTNSDIIACGYCECFTDGYMNSENVKREIWLEEGEKEFSEMLIQLIEGKFDSFVWNKLYKRCVFDKYRFPEGRVYEDQVIMPYLIEQANKVMMIRQPLVFYRKRANSITTTFSEKNVLDWLEARKQIETFVLAHVPHVFSVEQYNRFMEISLRRIIGCYLDLVGNCSKSSKAIHAFESEIRVRGKMINSFSLKTHFSYYLCKLSPHFAYYIKRLYSDFLTRLDLYS